MGTELKTDSSQRWVLYGRDAYECGRIFLTTEQKQAVEEGKVFAQRAYADVWARDDALVRRVRLFLGQRFHWHRKLAKTGTDLSVIQTLQSMICGESVVLVAEPLRSGSATDEPTSKIGRLPSFRESLMTRHRMTYDAASDYIERYNAMVDRVRDDASRYAGGGKLALADDADTFTPLGEVQPFEYPTDQLEADSEQIAGMPYNGTPGSWLSSMPGTMRQLRQYGSGGTPITDIDFEAHHGHPNPHAHNWNGYDRDEGAPVSILPW